MTKSTAQLGGSPRRPTLRIDLIGLFAVIGVTTGGYLLGLAPALARRDVLAQQAFVLNARKSESLEAQQTLKAVQREIDDVREGLKKHPLTLRSAAQSNERMDDLARLVAEHGLMVQEIVNGHAKATRRFQQVPIHLSGRGTYRGCMALLADVAAEYHDMRIWRIELVDNPSERDAAIDFRFDFTWYAAP